MGGSLIKFLTDDRGATAIEYTLILGLVVLAMVGSFEFLSNALSDMYLFVSSSVTDVAQGGG